MKNIILIVLDSVRRDFFFKFIKNSINELKKDFVEFDNCCSIYTTTCNSHYTMFFGDYYGKSRNKNFPAQLKKLGFNVRSFCNCAIITGYALKNTLGVNINHITPFRFEIIDDLGIVPETNWNRKTYGRDFEDYYGASDDEEREIPKKWKKFIKNSKSEKNFIFLHFWNTHYNYGINDYIKNKIVGKSYAEIACELINRVQNKDIPERLLKKVYSIRIYQIINNYIKKLIENLKQNDTYNDSIIILTSDHGEGLGDVGKYCTKRQYSLLNFFIDYYNKRITKILKFLPRINNKFHLRWDFTVFFHGDNNKIQKEIPFFIKFPNNEFGGEIFHNKITLFDIIHTINEFIENKLDIQSNNGCSLYSLIKSGEGAREMVKINQTIKKLTLFK